MRIGLISDTHGLLRPQASSFLAGCDHIVHAGDIGGADVLRELASIAPVTAVRGNNDQGAWADALAEFELVRFGEILLYVVHDPSRRSTSIRLAREFTLSYPDIRTSHREALNKST